MQTKSNLRAQSQAGKSFAERLRVGELCSGMRKNFRPQVKNKLLLLLALLLTAATGAWAQDAKHLITATYDKQTRSLEQPLPYATTIGELYEAVTGESFSSLISRMSLVDMTLSGIGSTNTSVVSVGELNGASTPVTVNADGKATIGLRFGNFVQGIFVNVVSPLYAYVKDGVKDADKWTVKVGEGQAQALPIGGLKGDGSETVTLQYNGRLKVKGVKATSDAKPAPAGPPSWKLTLSSPAKDLYITANGGLIAQQTLDVASTEFTVEMPELTSQTVNIVATDGSGNCWYCTQENMSFAIGQTYQSSPTMNAVGTLSSAAVYKVTDSSPIPAGKTAVLSGVTFSSKISCSGDATIILMGNNTLNGGLQASPSGKTMTITGTGSLNARSSGYNPGIGAVDNNCGNIIICGGTITAQPGNYSSMAAGIGSGEEGTCGNITICGGTVTATGGVYSAGIGSGEMACGTVTITDGATKVTATGGNSAENSIGKGDGSCGTVTIDGVVNATTSSTFEHFNSDVSGNTWTLTHK